ncbi:MAG: hypothetical protein ABIR47_12070 [Candidatus Kapaibacterium sp.]
MIEDKEKMIVTETQPQGVSYDPIAHAHERTDIDARSILMSIAILGGVCIAVALAMWGMFHVLAASAEKRDVAPSPVADRNIIPPEPRLQAEPRLDMQEMRAHTDSVINSYGWVDRRSGVVRIPIDKAIDMVVAKGLHRPAPKSVSPGADTAAGRTPMRSELKSIDSGKAR